MKNLINSHSQLELKMRFLYFLGALLLLAVSACNGRNTVADLYRFSSTKNVNVQVNIAFKTDDTSGPTLDVAGKEYILNAYALDAGGRQVEIGTASQASVADFKVIMPGSKLTFSSVMRIPVEVQPRASGYALRFELKDTSAPLMLADADNSTLSALRGEIQAGTSPERNKVTLSLATTLAAQFIRSSLGDAGSSVSLQAYDDLTSLLVPRLQTVEASADGSKTQGLANYISAIGAGLKYQIMTDKAFQSQLTDKISAANANLTTDSEKSAAAIKLATAFTDNLITFATQVKSALGSTSSTEYGVFPVDTIDVASIPDPAEYSSAVFAPIALDFADTDVSGALGGPITVTPPVVSTGIKSYNIYFGGTERSNSKIALVGNISAIVTPLSLVLPSGTLVPSNGTKFWIYPVTGSDKELDVPAWFPILNVGGFNPTYPHAPANVFAAAGAGKNTVTWDGVLGATSYNIYWSTTTPVTTSANKIKGVSSPYAHKNIHTESSYYYSVTAVQSGLESALSEEAVIMPVSSSIPETLSATGNLVVTAGNTLNTITWSQTAGATSYDIYWSTAGTVSTSSNKIVGVTSPYNHTGLTNGTTYSYAVVAHKGNIDSPLSTVDSATPFIPGPGPASLTSAIAATAQVTLNWNTVSGATSYHVKRGTVSGSYPASVTTTSALTYVDTHLVNGQTYFYAVYAVDATGESAAANELFAKPVWTPTELGSTGVQFQLSSMVSGLDGSVYVGGSSGNSVDGNAMIGRNDIYVSKYNRAGSKLWTKTFGATSGANKDLYLSKLVVDASGNLFIAGTTYGNISSEPKFGNQDLFLIKLDPDGNQLLIKELGNSAQPLIVQAMAMDPQGNSYVLFNYGRSFFPGSNPPHDTQIGVQDAVVIKFDPTFAPVWAHHVGMSSGNVEGKDLIVDGAAMYVAGSTTSAFPGSTMLSSEDGFVVKYDLASNAQIWSVQVGANAYNSANGYTYGSTLSIGSSGELYLGGYDYADLDGTANADSANGASFVTKISATGTKLWTKAFTSSGGLDISHVVADNLGNIYMSTISYGGPVLGLPAIGSEDLFLTRLNSNGEVVWKHMYGFTSRATEGGFVGIDTDGGICLGANVDSLVTSGTKSASIIKFTNDGLR